jgi:hypothetical protein
VQTCVHTTAKPAATRRTYSRGHGMPDVDGKQIEAEAKAAAAAGHSLNYACPYPYQTEAGQHFVAVYYLNRRATPSTAQVLARSAHALEIATP